MNTFHSMNTTFYTMGMTEEQDLKVETWVRYVESKLSRFHPNSELSRLNQNPVVSFIASDLLFTISSLAEHYYLETDGCFNPFMGQVLAEWGYDKSFEWVRKQEVDYAQIYHKIIRKRGYQHPIILDGSRKTIQLAPNRELDLGGLAKGWSVQKISQWLVEEGARFGVIDGGGDIILWGMETNPQTVSIADPFYPERDIILLRTSRDLGIATSSTVKRRWSDRQGRPIHHLLDPSTNCPSQSDIIQATVIAPNLVQAEVYAKCLLIKGTQGFPWLQTIQPEVAYLVVTEHHALKMSPNLIDYCHDWEVL